MASVTSGQVNTEFKIDGVSLGPDAPTLYSNTGANSGTVTLQNGGVVQPGVMSFFIGADEYFILQNGYGSNLPSSGHIDPNRVTGVVITNKFEMTGSAHSWDQFKMFDKTMATYQGDALMVFGSTGSTPSVVDVFVFDDDSTIELSPTGSVETGLNADAKAGTTPLHLDNTSVTTENLVTVSYTTATGSGSFNAIATTYYTQTFYIPQNGHVDLSTITGITSVVETTTPVNGASYDAFGLTADKFVQMGDATDETIFGDIGPDLIDGKAGNDTLFGDAGDDLIRGGAGKDTLYGGAGQDTLIGGAGKDTLYGGMHDDNMLGGGGNDQLIGGEGDDTLKGKNGNDTLFGGRGNDTLNGDTGKDSLRGGSGNDTLLGGGGNDNLKGQAGADTLNGGRGADTLTGGKGADVFVFTADGKKDTITDFQDGTDLIDLDVAFASLTITDVSAGKVKIIHSGETLIVEDDGLGLLTAADFSAADFL